MTRKGNLQYSDDTDRAYGVTGMTIALMLWNGDQYLAEINIDNPVGSGIQFTPAFGFSGNPRLTATLAWRELFHQFELSAAMIMGNAYCRSYVGKSTPVADEVIAELQDLLRAEGRETCDLEHDEVDIVYKKTHRYLDRVFTHVGVTSMARDFARELMVRRKLSAGEVSDLLSDLR